MIKQSQIDYLPQPLASANNIDLLTTDKTQHFAQPCPITVNYFLTQTLGRDFIAKEVKYQWLFKQSLADVDSLKI